MTPTTTIPTQVDESHQGREFALWSQVYDEPTNPLLELEERFLAPSLPEIRGRHVLDVGCGTGRWLTRLVKLAPASLTGIDSSPEMLARARKKVARTAVLAMGSATCLPVAELSADVVMASFVASYIEDLDAFATQLRRVVRENATICVSDVHPETEAACNWKRGFRTEIEHTELVTRSRSIQEVVACFDRAGFRVTCRLEPPFEDAERETFRHCGKLEAFHAAVGLPAIYILQLRAKSSRTGSDIPGEPGPHRTLSRARTALDARTTILVDVEVQGGRIGTLSSPQRKDLRSPTIDLHGYLLFPGLINAHDHLEFGLYPNLGRGPYNNSVEWATDIQQKDAATIAAHQSIPRDVRLWWGALRNLLCGVTTVCHHNPVHAELLNDEFPIRVITDLGWAHSLAMESAVQDRYRGTPSKMPFVLHAGEGIDGQSATEIFELDKLGVLGERTVLVHGLALGDEGTALLNRRGAALVWCPSSNRFLFNRTHMWATLSPIKRLLLGSDSPLTARGDLLDEIRMVHRELGVSADDVYSMVFDNAPDVLHLRNGEGRLRPHSHADFFAVRDGGMEPADTLVNLTASDVELVMVRGRVQLASEEIYGRLQLEAKTGLQPLMIDSQLRWVRAPLARMFGEAERVLGSELRVGGRRVRHADTTCS